MDQELPTRLAVIIGSTRTGRFGPIVASWYARVAGQRPDLDVDVVDLAAADLPEVSPAEDGTVPPAVAELTPRLERADAFVVVTPEYNHSFPAALKTAIDWFFDEWMAKPVGFVSYGGIGGGLRAVEALRLVFAELHATTIRDVISFHDHPARFSQEGTPHDPRAETAAKSQLDQLTWWADALRLHRTRVPYRA